MGCRTLRALGEVFRTPVPPGTRAALRVAWARVPGALRTPSQFLGRQYVGCGATIGAMPRCDFACRGCYLGEGANDAPAASVDGIKEQLRRLRDWLGEGGNLQLTDGEVTLRPVGELIELIREARAVGLVPMLMTHGDAFRRRPGLLERLMVEAGLTEVSIHIDTTQRGRRGYPARTVRGEADLMALRDEFAALIRNARRATGRTLDVATTMTVTRDNVDDVPAVIRWVRANADTFKMISFQPVAQVGRTEIGLGGSVTVDELWARVAEGLHGDPGAAARLTRQQGWLGHPGCSRFVQGVVVSQPGAAPAFVPLYDLDDARDRRAIDGWMARFGGFTLRLDTRARVLARLAGIVWHAPAFMALTMLPFVLRLPGRWDPGHPWRAAWRWLRGRTRASYLNIVSHHFMSPAELASPPGLERLDLCVFKVAVGRELVSMCEVNALGGRDRYYATLRTARPRERVSPPATSRPEPVTIS